MYQELVVSYNCVYYIVVCTSCMYIYVLVVCNSLV